MTQRKTRVLLDLTLALRGYSGIPQDTRLLYKTLSLCPELEVTGLLYPAAVRFRRHKFCGPSASRAERLANQACFLWAMNEPPSAGGSLPRRVARRLSAELAARTNTRAATEETDATAFRQTLWRSVFAQSLSPDDMSLLQGGRFRFMNISSEAMHRRVVLNRSPIRLDTNGYDFFIVQTARPMRITPGTQQLVRYHDMIPVMQADTTPHLRDIRWHHHSIAQSIGSYFVCNSEPTRENLVDVYPELRDRSTTIPYMLSDAFRPEANEAMVNSIIRSRRSSATGGGSQRRARRRSPRYIMGVSTLEPRKNFAGLIQAFNMVRFRKPVARTFPNLKLLIVGSPGWKFEPILRSMRELVAHGDIIHLESVTAEELRVLYSQAEALVYPSHAEGFGFPPLEAMQCDLPVIASDIPEHRWVLGDAAMYCNSYDVNSIADSIQRLLASDESALLRRELIDRGRERIERYALERCREQWMELLDRLSAGRPAVADELSAESQSHFVAHGPMDRAA
ncbi:MAG: glycosyltransferase family 1 protein [Planctomycetota bacterium]|nr:MAG: glycosyltransferase family 1 protein [Planctomycetota bacterium]